MSSYHICFWRFPWNNVGRIEGKTHLPEPDGSCFFWCSPVCTWLSGLQVDNASSWSAFNSERPEVLLCLSALHNFFSQSVAMSGIAPAWVQHLTLGLLELHEMLVGLLPKHVHVSLGSTPSFCLSGSRSVTCSLWGETDPSCLQPPFSGG